MAFIEKVSLRDPSPVCCVKEGIQACQTWVDLQALNRNYVSINVRSSPAEWWPH